MFSWKVEDLQKMITDAQEGVERAQGAERVSRNSG